MIGGQFNTKPGMGSGAQAPLPSGGIQGGSAPLQQNIQQRVPNQGQFNGNPRGVYNTNFRGQGNAPSYMQQTNLGRYVPPTMSDGGRFGFNSNQWNNFGGYDYNLPGSYGSPQGGGQFAPMPGQFAQYMNPSMLSGNTFAYNDPFAATMLGGMNMQPYRDRAMQEAIRNFGGGRQQLQDMARPAVVGWRPEQGMSFSDQEFGQPRMRAGFGSYDPGGSLYQDPREREQFSAYLRQMNELGQQMPPGKDGRPLQTGFAPMPGPRAPRDNRAGPMMEDIPAYDRPENRSYNMNALYQMMGGWG